MTETTPKKRSRFRKHPILTVLWVLILLGILGSAMKWGNSSSTTSNTSTSTKTQATYKVWDVVPTGKITYTVSDVKSTSTVWSAYSKKQASGIFKVITITVKNTGKEPLTVDSNLFKLIDDQWREFSSSVEWRTALTMQWEKDFFLTQAQPWLDISGKLVFDVPADAKGLKLQVSGWFWSSNKNLINIE